MLKNFQCAITLTLYTCLTLGLTNSVKAVSLDLTTWDTLGDVSVVSNNQVLLSNDADLDDDLELGVASGTFNFSGTPAVDNLFKDLEFFLGLNPGDLSGVEEGSVIQTKLSVKAGDKLSFDWNFMTNETSELLPTSYNDHAFMIVNSQVIKLANVADSRSASSLFNSETGLQSYTYEFIEAGNYNIGFGVFDLDDIINSSALSVSNITLNTPANNQPIPESSSVVGLLIFGILSTVFRFKDFVKH